MRSERDGPKVATKNERGKVRKSENESDCSHKSSGRVTKRWTERDRCDTMRLGPLITRGIRMQMRAAAERTHVRQEQSLQL